MQSNSSVATLTNVPSKITKSFALKVDDPAGDGYVRQTFIEFSGGKIITRTYFPDLGTWGSESSYVTESDLNAYIQTRTVNIPYSIEGNSISNFMYTSPVLDGYEAIVALPGFTSSRSVLFVDIWLNYIRLRNFNPAAESATATVTILYKKNDL